MDLPKARATCASYSSQSSLDGKLTVRKNGCMMSFLDRRPAGRIRVLALSAAVALLSSSANGFALASPSAPPATYSQVRAVPGTVRAVGRYRSVQAHLAALSAQHRRTFRLPSALARVTAVSAHQEVRISGIIPQDGRLARTDYYCAHQPLRLERVSGDLTQGGTIVASGSCFGKTAGGVKMLGPFPNGAISLVVQSWTDQTVTAKVPALTGVPDQPVKIELVAPAQGGQTNVSPDVSMIFVSQRRVANVYTMVENLSCGAGEHPAMPNRGTWLYGTDLGYDCYPTANVNWVLTTSAAVHNQLAPDSGSDTWRVHMQPGWRFDHIDVSDQADLVIDPSIDATNVSWTTTWHTVTASWSDFSAGPGQRTEILHSTYDGSYIVEVYGSGPV